MAFWITQGTTLWYWIAWPCMALYGLVWPYLALHELLRHRSCLYIAFSQGHRSKPNWSCYCKSWKKKFWDFCQVLGFFQNLLNIRQIFIFQNRSQWHIKICISLIHHVSEFSRIFSDFSEFSIILLIFKIWFEFSLLCSCNGQHTATPWCWLKRSNFPSQLPAR